MTAWLKHRLLNLIAIPSLVAAIIGLPAQAALYTFNFNDSGVIPQGGTAYSVEHLVNIADTSITSFQIILTFNDSSSLLGNSSGIQGHIILGTAPNSPYVSFYPEISYSGEGSQKIYDVTFSGSAGNPGTGFFGLNPNNTWGLVLWDNGENGIENQLIGWTLKINAIPEPTTWALVGFVALLCGAKLFSLWRATTFRTGSRRRF